MTTDEQLAQLKDGAPWMTKGEAAQLLEAAPRNFAWTMPRYPHSWTMTTHHKEYWQDRHDLFLKLIYSVDEWRVPRPFLNRTTWYWDANGWQYWFMSPKGKLAPPQLETTVNIAPRWYLQPEVAAYESSPFRYEMHAVIEKQRRAHYSELPLRDADVLDIGCGTGMLVDYAYKRLSPERYVGLDPAGSPLRYFAEKHSDFASSLVRCTFEEYWPTRRFDVIACMFGSGSYIGTEENLRKAMDLLRPGGVLYVMFYDIDYEGGMPRHYPKMGIERIEGIRQKSLRSSDPSYLGAAAGERLNDAETVNLGANFRGFVTKRWVKQD